MAAGQAEAHVLAMNERMFLDDGDKDVTFELADGREHAHKAFLKASSEVFARMLEQDMREKATGVIALPEVRKSEMRVFLRLVYTGHVDASDWADGEEAPEEKEEGSVTLSGQMNMTVNGRHLTSTANQYRSAALLGNGSSDFEFSVRAESWPALSEAMVGIAPLGAEPCQSMYTKCGYYGCISSGDFSLLYAQDGTSGKTFSGAWPSPLPAGATVTVKLQDGSLSFAAAGSPFATASFNAAIQTGTLYRPAVLLFSSGSTVEVVHSTCTRRRQCPLDILTGVALLAKKYMVSDVVSMVTQALKDRIASAKQTKDVGAFEQILAGAISGDIGAVRMAALDSARDFAELRSRYDAGGLCPEVAHDLQAIWPPRPLKRLKGECLS